MCHQGRNQAERSLTDYFRLSGPFPEMLDCGGRNYEDGSCVLFSLSNQRPVIFSPALKEEIGEQVSWRALFYLCWRDCAQGPRRVSQELISIPAFAFVLMSSTETGRAHPTPEHGEQTGWRCCTGASGWTEPRAPGPAGVLHQGAAEARGAPVCPNSAPVKEVPTWTHSAADGNLPMTLSCRVAATPVAMRREHLTRHKIWDTQTYRKFRVPQAKSEG